MTSRIPFADVDDEPMLNIKAVSQATGIESVTLRAWERRYGMPKPERSQRGYRLYSERDIAILDWLKARVEEGVTIKHAVAMLESQAPQIEKAEHEPAEQHQPFGLNGDVNDTTKLTELVDTLIDTAIRFDTADAQRIIKQAFVLYPVEDVCIKLILPTLERIGEAWENGEISLQVEHFTSHLIRQQLLALGATMPSPWRSGRIVAGCAPDDWHEMGILMLSLFLRRRGWEVIFLGQAVGLERLEESLHAIQPDALILSSGHLNTAINLLEAGELVSAHNDIYFIYGGGLLQKAPELVGHYPGVFGGQTLVEARDRIDALLAGVWEPDPTQSSDIPGDLSELYKALKSVNLTLTDGISGLLLEAAPKMERPTATQHARHTMSALLAAVRFNIPSLMHADVNPARRIFITHQVPYEQLIELFDYYVKDTNHLTPFLDALYHND